MLTELRISNFSIIQQLSLQFADGFTVLTGETGAGKSLLIDAITLLIGGRASADQIRTGVDEAQLEAAFSLQTHHPLTRRLREQGLLRSDETDVILRRVVSRSGRHRIYCNGNLCSLHALEGFAGQLVDIHGQHDQQALAAAETQLEMLDAFGGALTLREEYKTTYDKWKTIAEELEAARRQQGELVQREELLRYQLGEIEEANPGVDEEVRLEAERQRLAHAYKLGELSQQLYGLLNGDEQGVLSQLPTGNKILGELNRIDDATQEWAKPLTDAIVELKDLADQVRRYRDQLTHDPDRLTQVESRLELFSRLKKKYGGSLDAVLGHAERLRVELEQGATSADRLLDLERRKKETTARLNELASALTQCRREAAVRMECQVMDELASIRMERAILQVNVVTDQGEGRYGQLGWDRVEFLFTGNPGEPPKPLSKVASGGELSRVMLAIKTVMADRDRVPVLIFDEVDAGVGGAVAEVVGKRLRGLGKHHQVFCITHLPQVASQAHHHCRVEKSIDRNRTLVQVEMLDHGKREREIARMLAGVTVTRKVRETAAEMICQTRQEG